MRLLIGKKNGIIAKNRIGKMKKIKYGLLLAAVVVFFASCSKQNPITGPAGAQGVSGVPGGNLIYAIKYATLSYTDLQGSGKLFHYSIWYPYYNKNNTYMITGYGTKVLPYDTVRYPEWYKMPWTNVYVTGDELYCSLGNDTIKVWYFNPSGGTFPASADSSISCKFIIIPQQ